MRAEPYLLTSADFLSAISSFASRCSLRSSSLGLRRPGSTEHLPEPLKICPSDWVPLCNRPQSGEFPIPAPTARGRFDRASVRSSFGSIECDRIQTESVETPWHRPRLGKRNQPRISIIRHALVVAGLKRPDRCSAHAPVEESFRRTRYASQKQLAE
jgi:hypothetical protein